MKKIMTLGLAAMLFGVSAVSAMAEDRVYMVDNSMVPQVFKVENVLSDNAGEVDMTAEYLAETGLWFGQVFPNYDIQNLGSGYFYRGMTIAEVGIINIDLNSVVTELVFTSSVLELTVIEDGNVDIKAEDLEYEVVENIEDYMTIETVTTEEDVFQVYQFKKAGTYMVSRGDTSAFSYYPYEYAKVFVVTDDSVTTQTTDTTTETETQTQTQTSETTTAVDTTPKVATATASKVVVNGTVVEFDAYNIDDNNYFKLRDIAMAVNGTEKQFEVGWDGTNQAISLTSNAAYTPAGGELALGDGSSKTATATSATLYLDGNQVSPSAYVISDNNYLKLRDLGEYFDFAVTWNATENAIEIVTGLSYSY